MEHHETEYLKFLTHQPDSRKTPIVVIFSKSKNVKLGEIKWFPAWRQFCFYPEGATIWNPACMKDVDDVIKKLMDDRWNRPRLAMSQAQGI